MSRRFEVELPAVLARGLLAPPHRTGPDANANADADARRGHDGAAHADAAPASDGYPRCSRTVVKSVYGRRRGVRVEPPRTERSPWRFLPTGDIPLGSTIDTRNGRISLRFEPEDEEAPRDGPSVLRRHLPGHPGGHDHRPQARRGARRLPEEAQGRAPRRPRRPRRASCGATARASSAPRASTARPPSAAPSGSSRTPARARSPA